jgi:membrane protease YdiL (CAAX protease family)
MYTNAGRTRWSKLRTRLKHPHLRSNSGKHAVENDLQLGDGSQEEVMRDRRELLVFFGLTFTITWGIGLIALLFPVQLCEIFGDFSEGNPLFFLAVFSPTLSACLLTALVEGRNGLKKLVSSLGRWRFHVSYYVFILLVIPALGYGAVLLAGGGDELDLGKWYLFLPLLFCQVFTDPGPLGEELGWRGFALPRLLRYHPPIKTSLILGVIWGLWHLPAFYVSGLPQEGASFLFFFLGAIVLSFLSTYLYIRTRGSVLITALLHLTTNFSLSVIGAPLWIFILLLAIAVGILILVSGPNKFIREPVLSQWSQLPSS